MSARHFLTYRYARRNEAKLERRSHRRRADGNKPRMTVGDAMVEHGGKFPVPGPWGWPASPRTRGG